MRLRKECRSRGLRFLPQRALPAKARMLPACRNAERDGRAGRGLGEMLLQLGFEDGGLQK